MRRRGPRPEWRRVAGTGCTAAAAFRKRPALPGPAPGTGARADLACSFVETPQTSRRLRPPEPCYTGVAEFHFQVYAKVSEVLVCSWFLRALV